MQPSLRIARRCNASWFVASPRAGHALLGFARGGKVGLPIEKIWRDFRTSEIAERYFSEAERFALRDLPAEERHEAFFRRSTCKEAL